MRVRGVCQCVFVCVHLSVCACVQQTGSRAAEDSRTEPGISARPPARRLLTWKRRFCLLQPERRIDTADGACALPLVLL